MINKTILQGRLVRDPELRQTQSGISVASFTVAWSEKYKDTEKQCFLPCTAWQKTGEFICNYFKKGQEIVVEGRLETRKWVDNDGENRSTTELIVDKAHFCGSKAKDADMAPPNGYPQNAPGFVDVDTDDEELPF